MAIVDISRIAPEDQAEYIREYPKLLAARRARAEKRKVLRARQEAEYRARSDNNPVRSRFRGRSNADFQPYRTGVGTVNEQRQNRPAPSRAKKVHRSWQVTNKTHRVLKPGRMWRVHAYGLSFTLLVNDKRLASIHHQNLTPYPEVSAVRKVRPVQLTAEQKSVMSVLFG